MITAGKEHLAVPAEKRIPIRVMMLDALNTDEESS
jgi:hypothetical protein